MQDKGKIVFLLIPAAGSGRRMGADRNKLLLNLMGQPLIAWTLQAVERSPSIQWIGLIGQPEDWPDFKAIVANLNLTKTVQFTVGGSTRQESVFRGLQALPPEAEQVLIHDGARCLVTPDLFDRCAVVVRQTPGLVAAVPVKDTIKQVSPETDLVEQTLDRSRLWAVQTPQGFHVNLLKQCHEQGKQNSWQVTDDAALFERCQLPVRIVVGEETNLKITTPVDLAIAELILRQRV